MSERFTPELPARLLIAERLAKLRREMTKAAIGSLTLTEKQKAWAEQDAVLLFNEVPQNAPEDVINLEGGTPPFTANLLGSDMAKVQYLQPYPDGHPEGSGNNMGITLYQDGSPYVREEDIDAASYSVQYEILTLPDMAPVAIHGDYFARIPLGAGRQEFNWILTNYPQSVHYLTDDECSTIYELTEQARPYVDTLAFASRVNKFCDTDV